MDFGVGALLTDLDVGVMDLARMVEQAGFESLFLAEHTHVPVSRRDVHEDPNRQDARIVDHLVALGAAAAVTSRLRLGTICVVAQRDPILLAKHVATLDHISGGRVLFGVVAGWLEEEMHNHGVDPVVRWDLMREHVLAIKEIWSQEEAEFHGQYVDFDPIWMWPKAQPPIIVGGHGPRSLRVVAELADGWLPIVYGNEQFERAFASFTHAFEEVGRPRVDVTAFLEPDERLLEVCAEHQVRRCAFLMPDSPVTATAFATFLYECSRLRDQFS